MFRFFVRVVSPYFILLGLLTLYLITTGQNGHELINGIVDSVSFLFGFIQDIFNRV